VKIKADAPPKDIQESDRAISDFEFKIEKGVCDLHGDA